MKVAASGPNVSYRGTDTLENMLQDSSVTTHYVCACVCVCARVCACVCVHVCACIMSEIGKHLLDYRVQKIRWAHCKGSNLNTVLCIDSNKCSLSSSYL